MSIPLILLTNDDGVHAPGLTALAEALDASGRTIIVAPERDNSAASHSLTMNRPLRVNKVKPDVFMVDGTPADCVTLALEKILPQPPDLLISGINPGANLGNDISYSGTVSAAREGAIRLLPSFAVSLLGHDNFDFSTAACFSVKLAQQILAKNLPEKTFLNVNIPSLDPALIKGVKITRQGRRAYKNSVTAMFDPQGRKCYWIGGGDTIGDRGKGTDSHEVAEGYISITPVHLDLTNDAALKKISHFTRLAETF